MGCICIVEADHARGWTVISRDMAAFLPTQKETIFFVPSSRAPTQEELLISTFQFPQKGKKNSPPNATLKASLVMRRTLFLVA